MKQIVGRCVVAVLLGLPWVPGVAQGGTGPKDSVVGLCSSVSDMMGLPIDGVPFVGSWNNTGMQRRVGGDCYRAERA